MGNPAIKHERYSYADYLRWDENERWEIIEGTPYDMLPAPARIHQDILGKLYLPIANYLKGKKCKVYLAPFDVRLAEKYEDDSQIETVVQPDLSVFCDEKKLDERGAKGAPDWVIEILSPGSSKKDIHEKLLLYQKYGVKEYWLVNYNDKVVTVLILDNNGKYPLGKSYCLKEKISPSAFPRLIINLKSVFD